MNEESTGVCESCKKQVMIRRKGTNHILHLLMTCLTMGFWIVIWILAACAKGHWRCTQCGRITSRKRPVGT
jgi:hypothetical protein